jgi:hypothetical protein
MRYSAVGVLITACAIAEAQRPSSKAAVVEAVIDPDVPPAKPEEVRA